MFLRLALKLVMLNDEDFVYVILLYTTSSYEYVEDPAGCIKGKFFYQMNNDEIIKKYRVV